MKVALATRNADKAGEIARLLEGTGVTIMGLDQFPGIPETVEDGDTLEENALKKAREVSEATGLSALADDTGLEVDALGGAPGVFAARFAGPGATYADNCKKLLADLGEIDSPERTARFRTVVALVLCGDARRRAGGAEAIVTEGILPGRITREPRGTGGFGYDPVFLAPESGKTLAEMSASEKNAISHRYRALVELREAILRAGLVEETQ